MAFFPSSKLFNNTYDLQRLIDWRMQSLKVLRGTPLGEQLRKERPMQRMFTIELRVDYADPDKNEAMRNILRQCARRAYSTAQLLADGVKPEVAIYSEDFFCGNEEISLLGDILEDKTAEDVGSEPSGISDELAAAARGGI